MVLRKWHVTKRRRELPKPSFPIVFFCHRPFQNKGWVMKCQWLVTLVEKNPRAHLK